MKNGFTLPIALFLLSFCLLILSTTIFLFEHQIHLQQLIQESYEQEIQSTYKK